MRKKAKNLMCVFLSFIFLFSFSACQRSGYKPTGVIEKGKLVVWLSYDLTQDYINNSYPFSTVLGENSGFAYDITYVQFNSENDFAEAVMEKIMSGEGPDVILATPDELSSKLFEADVLMDLTPFFDYYNKKGEIHSDDLMTSVFDLGTYNGSLYAVPLCFSASYAYASSNDDAMGLHLITDKNITFNEYLSRIGKYIDKNGKDGAFMLGDILPPVYYAFSNLIDYEKRTAHMDNDAAYQYYCYYAESRNVGKQIEDLYKKFSSQNADTFYDAANDWYYSNILYQSGYPTAYNRKGADTFGYQGYTLIPYITDKGPVTLVSSPVVAAIPANADKKEKAFAYIASAFEFETVMNNNQTFAPIPMLKSAIKADISQLSKLNDNEKNALYQQIVNAHYLSTRQDPQILKFFNDFLNTYDKETKTYSKIIPTREQWDALKDKIELYLNE